MREQLARLYGRLPYHPGKWRVLSALLPAHRPPELRTVRVFRDMKCDVNLGGVMGEHLYYLGSHEFWETRLVRRLVKPSDVALDLGANIGYYTLLLSKLVGPAGHVYAFEPATASAEILGRNIRQNRLHNVTIERLAVGDRCGEAAIGGGSAETLRIVDDDGVIGAHEMVRMTTLDAWATGFERLDFIKVDVEGFELAVLRGARAALRRFRPKILIEVCPENLAAAGATVGDLRRLLADLGYQVRIIDHWRLVTMRDQLGRYLANALAEPLV